MRIAALVAVTLATAQAATAEPRNLVGGNIADVGEAPASLLLSSSIALGPDSMFDRRLWVEDASGSDVSSLAGIYSAEIMETATALELTPDGRFSWFFSTGALDLVGQGRWRRTEDGALILDNDPPYEPPTFELASVARDERAGVLVRLDSSGRDRVALLDVEAEYADGNRVREPLRRAGNRLADAAGRAPVAVRLGSDSFGFRSEAFPVSADAGNVMTFRFLSDQLGRVDFRDQRVTIEPDGLSFEWRGARLHYARIASSGDALTTEDALAPVDRAAMTAAAADAESQVDEVPIRAGPLQPWEVPEGAPSAGLFDFTIGEAFDATAARSTFPFRPDAGLGNDFSDGVAEVRLRSGDSIYDAGRVSNLSWYVTDFGGVPPFIKAVGFSADRLLELGEALARARALQAWLEQAGFTPGGPPEADERPPFSLVDPYRYNEQAAGWDAAATLLADEEAGIQGMDLFRMRARGWYATVTVMNYSRQSGGPAVAEPGREWDLQVQLFTELVQEIPEDDVE